MNDAGSKSGLKSEIRFNRFEYHLFPSEVIDVA